MIRRAFCSWERVPEFRKPKLLLAVMAEFIGTFILMVVSVGAIRFSRGDKITQLAPSYGLVLASLVCMFGGVRGGHFNPAVTLSFAVIGKIPLTDATLYFLMQLTASIAASYFLSLTSNRLHGESEFHVFTNFDESLCVSEAIAMFLIVFVTLTAYGSKGGICREPACLVIGLTLLGFCFYLWDYTGSCLNPLRAFGPAFIEDDWTHHYLTWVGPLAGGLLASIVYEIMPKPFDCERDRQEEEEEKAEEEEEKMREQEEKKKMMKEKKRMIKEMKEKQKMMRREEEAIKEADKKDEKDEEEEEPKPKLPTLPCTAGNPISTFVDNFWRVMLS